MNEYCIGFQGYIHIEARSEEEAMKRFEEFIFYSPYLLEVENDRFE